MSGVRNAGTNRILGVDHHSLLCDRAGGSTMIFNRLVYLAGPIDHSEHALNWRENAATIFHRYGFGCFSPAHAYLNIQRAIHASSVDAINRVVLANSQFMFAMFNDDFSIGTTREVEFAASRLQPVYLFSPHKETTRKLRDSFMTHDCVVCEDTLLGDAIRFVVDQETQRHIKYMNGLSAFGSQPETEETDRGA